MSRFSGLKTQLEPKSTSLVPALASPAVNAGRAKAREGKKAVVGYFSDELSRAMRRLALDESSSVQALLGEAVDLLMRDRGKHPFGER
jgi:antitoxin-like ribbon-helix-helix protein